MNDETKIFPFISHFSKVMSIIFSGNDINWIILLNADGGLSEKCQNLKN